MNGNIKKKSCYVLWTTGFLIKKDQDKFKFEHKKSLDIYCESFCDTKTTYNSGGICKYYSVLTTERYGC